MITSLNIGIGIKYAEKSYTVGEKTRLCLATRIYLMLKYNKDVLILDEPEQG